ncbi:hypothetical protein NIES37_62680 [Tolypothrix tenuis PCC 7101]|uniref:Uncharacterized protein n=1 Tax=Tolypothrix tenuis PCC 7101 TaxID=231146 RepID=A0A1Z4N954_9CYAN|nr:hypothetical protein NIES37_62680 [Tolypothrix tenuis PCC 7101]BAZ73823.1 hypothetical protein NIES50_23890 [Aulosira laxa NIES-50]
MLRELSLIKNLILFVIELLNFMRSLDPKLTREQAILMTCMYLKATPGFFAANSEIPESLKEAARKLTSER